jgi:hypothetical protein
MSKELLMQFVGFESKATVREYRFIVREASTEPREFAITIAHEAFNERRGRFQDGPDVCALRLRRELTTGDNHSPASHLSITNAELDDYYQHHAPPTRSMLRRGPPKSG